MNIPNISCRLSSITAETIKSLLNTYFYAVNTHLCIIGYVHSGQNKDVNRKEAEAEAYLESDDDIIESVID